MRDLHATIIKRGRRLSCDRTAKEYNDHWGFNRDTRTDVLTEPMHSGLKRNLNRKNI